LAEQFKPLRAAAVVGGDELTALLSGLGAAGDSCSRLSAVVALLTGGAAAGRQSGGAFAYAGPMVEDAFTSGFHNLLRERPVNVAHDSHHQSRPRKQC
jgi:hypothetical protein